MGDELRHAFTLAHRWVGLAIAAFLVVSGGTGAIIAWEHELDELLNPHLFLVSTPGNALPPTDLARMIEAREPRARVIYVPFVDEPGHARVYRVEGRRDLLSGKRFQLGYSEVFIDPATGAELGRRQWGQTWPVTRETLIPFLYVLHYSLHLPAFWGISEWGFWLMGAVAMAWCLDCFVGFYLTLPLKKRVRTHRGSVEHQLTKSWWDRWKPAWKIKRSGSTYRKTFDTHRALGLWTWGMLFILAFTGVSLNLYREIFLPVVTTVATVTPTPYETRKPQAANLQDPEISFAKAAELGAAEVSRRGWDLQVGGIRYAGEIALYEVRLFRDGKERLAGVRHTILYIDAHDGRLVADRQPWSGTSADIFIQAQLPLHSGSIIGLPGRILISVMGLVVAGLSVTGVIIWSRKFTARKFQASDASRAAVGHQPPREI
jgi:uncharacterized iron-regulated membrane protein